MILQERNATVPYKYEVEDTECSKGYRQKIDMHSQVIEIQELAS